MRLVLRLYSYLFHLVISLFLLGLSLVAILSGVNNLNLGMLPWEGSQLTYAIFILGLAGLSITVLAIFGRLRLLFPLWAALILFLIFRGFFVSPFVFRGPEQFRAALWLTLGALAAFACSFAVFQRRKTEY